MKSTTPPAFTFATWLLKRSGINEALSGDLIEQYRRGRSATWYWRQALIAIALRLVNDIREHKVLTARTVFVGWVVLIPWFYVTIAVQRKAGSWMNEVIPGAWSYGSMLQQMAWWAYWIYNAPLFLAWCVAALIVGQMVARLHGKHRVAVVCTCSASQLPWTVFWAWPVWQNAHGLLRGTAYAVPNQIVGVLILVAMPICTLIGGLWAAHDHESDRRQLAGQESSPSG